jgi:hypothetical protein
MVVDVEHVVLRWLWGEGGQEDSGLPGLTVRGLIAHDELMEGLRVGSLSYGKHGTHGTLLKAFVLPIRWLDPAHSS